VDLVDRRVRVASGSGEGCRSSGSRDLVELILVRVHGSDDTWSTEKDVQERKMREVDKGNGVLRRVLNGPCTGGHGGQVISKKSSHGDGPKARFVQGQRPT